MADSKVLDDLKSEFDRLKRQLIAFIEDKELREAVEYTVVRIMGLGIAYGQEFDDSSPVPTTKSR